MPALPLLAFPLPCYSELLAIATLTYIYVLRVDHMRKIYTARYHLQIAKQAVSQDLELRFFQQPF